jgi:hypothetical protein
VDAIEPPFLAIVSPDWVADGAEAAIMDRVALPAWEGGWELVQLSSGIRVARMALPGIPASAWGSYHRRDTEKPIAALEDIARRYPERFALLLEGQLVDLTPARDLLYEVMEPFGGPDGDCRRFEQDVGLPEGWLEQAPLAGLLAVWPRITVTWTRRDGSPQRFSTALQHTSVPHHPLSVQPNEDGLTYWSEIMAHRRRHRAGPGRWTAADGTYPADPSPTEAPLPIERFPFERTDEARSLRLDDLNGLSVATALEAAGGLADGEVSAWADLADSRLVAAGGEVSAKAFWEALVTAGWLYPLGPANGPRLVLQHDQAAMRQVWSVAVNVSAGAEIPELSARVHTLLGSMLDLPYARDLGALAGMAQNRWSGPLSALPTDVRELVVSRYAETVRAFQAAGLADEHEGGWDDGWADVARVSLKMVYLFILNIGGPYGYWFAESEPDMQVGTPPEEWFELLHASRERPVFSVHRARADLY